MDPVATDLEPLRAAPLRWLVTGAAGFIGSHLVETLLSYGQDVIGLDDFSTGRRDNLRLVADAVGQAAWRRFSLVEGDVRDAATVAAAAEGASYVLHHAALGSVPGSIADPATYHAVNVDGTTNVMHAARLHGVQGAVLASSAAVYGDDETQPKVEDVIGRPLSPYALGKWVGEQYATLKARLYEQPVVSLRYFNVVGPRQDPHGQYAAVVPRWLALLREGLPPIVHGDGEQTRDFCPVADVVHANVRAALRAQQCRGRVYNIGLGRRTSLRELLAILREGMAARGAPCADVMPIHEPPRPGDIRHSHADVSRARAELGYAPHVELADGLAAAMDAAMLVSAA